MSKPFKGIWESLLLEQQITVGANRKQAESLKERPSDEEL